MYLGPIHYTKEEENKSAALGTPYRQASTDRTWKYARNGAAALAAGKVSVTPLSTSAHENMSFQTAPAVGDDELKVTLGAGAVAANQYADGWIVVQDGTGEGHAYPIAGEHPAFSASATATFGLGHGETVLEAGALSETNVDLNTNRFSQVIISADSSQTDVIAGVQNIDVTAAYFFMIQTWGPAAVWADESGTLGAPITFGGGTAGQVENVDAAAEPAFGLGGPSEGVADEYQLVYLRIEP